MARRPPDARFNAGFRSVNPSPRLLYRSHSLFRDAKHCTNLRSRALTLTTESHTKHDHFPLPRRKSLQKSKIDQLIQKVLGEEMFSSIEIEPASWERSVAK